jgi:hypothetical protein
VSVVGEVLKSLKIPGLHTNLATKNNPNLQNTALEYVFAASRKSIGITKVTLSSLKTVNTAFAIH